MEVELVASDSLGVRSMCVMVRTPDVSILLDPGVALGPLRFSLPPAEEELEALDHYTKIIDGLAAEADILAISHYHWDHHTPSPEYYLGKKVFLKDIDSNINKSQKERGENLLSIIDGMAETSFVDGIDIVEGGTSISFSPPMPHGPSGTRLGYVLMTAVSEGDQTMVHTSDVEGVLTEEEVQWILEKDPDLVIADGPPAYLLGYKFSRKSMDASIENFKRLLECSDCKLVVDHHLLRSANYNKKMGGLFDDPRVYTFASYKGLEDNLLEANRKQLHSK